MSDNLQQAVISLIASQVAELNLQTSVNFDPSVTGKANNMDLHHRTSRVNEDKHLFIVEFEANIFNEPRTFKIRAIFRALFRYDQEVTDEFLKSSFVSVNAPAIAYPFLRSFINTVTTNAGFSPIILPAINFIRSYHQSLEKKK